MSSSLLLFFCTHSDLGLTVVYKWALILIISGFSNMGPSWHLFLVYLLFVSIPGAWAAAGPRYSRSTRASQKLSCYPTVSLTAVPALAVNIPNLKTISHRMRKIPTTLSPMAVWRLITTPTGETLPQYPSTTGSCHPSSGQGCLQCSSQLSWRCRWSPH